jgi:hypothetical protein
MRGWVIDSCGNSKGLRPLTTLPPEERLKWPCTSLWKPAPRFRVPGNGKRPMRKVAVVELTDEYAASGERPKMISDRAKGVAKIVEVWDRLNVGKTDKCAYRALKEARNSPCDSIQVRHDRRRVHRLGRHKRPERRRDCEIAWSPYLCRALAAPARKLRSVASWRELRGAPPYIALACAA